MLKKNLSFSHVNFKLKNFQGFRTYGNKLYNEKHMRFQIAYAAVLKLT